ncbi:DUF3530 family protein [Marinimicrobium agarilyticum]|uniref:DUF3530 family protein n=1 Tax=Marinimicrobium agarilyticum TaxID=306546 RepID=UPI000A02B3B8|nr:DUF3530 family protein [Marinimicrobium agarilyticum]
MTLQRTPKTPPPRLMLLLLCLFPALTGAQDEGAPAPLGEGTTEEVAPAANEPVDAVEPPRFASRRERDRELLAERFPDEARWLTLPEPEARALALYRPAMAEPKGALLMFYSADNPPHWPPPLANLRQSLPRHGWATFAVTLPTPEQPPVPERPIPESPPPPPAEETNETAGDGTEEPVEENEDTAAEEAGEPEAPANEVAEPPPEEPLPPRQERIANHVDAALQWLAENGQGNLVVLVDPLAAPEVLAVLQPQLEAGARGQPPSTGESPLSGPVRALILINRHGGVALSAEQLSQVFIIPELPILDVFVGPSALLQEQQRRHRDIARREQLNRYQNLLMGAPDVHDPENERSFWVRRIQGFMQRQAEGVEVNVPANRPLR